MENNKVTFDLQQKKCISENIVTVNKNWDIEEFKGDQKRARTEASQSYNTNIEKLIKMIETVQKEVVDRTFLKESDDSEEAKYGKQVKAKPMNLIRRQKEEHKYFLELAHADKEKLRKFIRMVDYMTIETLVKVNLQSMSILYEEM
jgi:dynein heavy chain